MSDFKNRLQLGILALATFILSVAVTSIAFSLTSAYPPRSSSLLTAQIPVTNPFLIPAGTPIPVRYEKANKILLTKAETMALTLTVADNIKNFRGDIIIPNGSEIIGEIKPSRKGSRFFSKKVIVGGKQQPQRSFSLDAISEVVTRIEKLIKGGDAEKIVRGAVLGESAAAVIAAITEDKPISEEVFRNTGLEALAGWLLRGESVDLVSIDPNKDLKLTLQSDFILK